MSTKNGTRLGLIILAVIVISIAMTPRVIIIKPASPEVKSPKVAIALAVEKYGVSEKTLTALAMCESSMRHDGVYGDSTLAYGLFQFHRPTFDMFKVKAGHPEFQYENMADQAELTAWALKNGYAAHWTCMKQKPRLDDSGRI